MWSYNKCEVAWHLFRLPTVEEDENKSLHD